MKDRPAVTLALTVHQPDERLAGMAERHLPALSARYRALAAHCSRETHPTLVALLRQHGAVLKVARGRSTGIHGIGAVRRETIRAALPAGTSHVQMCDFDRALHWVAHFPDELEAVAADIAGHDLLVLGRTPRAWATHPPYQAETEPLFNRVFALVTGLAWDIGAGSRGLSRRAVGALLETSQEPTIGIDAEWPLLLLRRDGFRVGHRLCEGLEFETADRFGPEIEAAGGYEAWEAGVSADPQQWAFRLEVALLIARAAVRYGRPAREDP
jgi:hypothetical protein